MKVQIVTNKARASDDFDCDDLIKAMEGRGYKHNGRRTRTTQIRPELADQPEFEGLCGPMWGGHDKATGEPILRFEDWGSYDLLSR